MKPLELSYGEEKLLKRWQRENPKLVRELQKAGQLKEVLHSRVEAWKDVYAEGVEKGLHPDQARELAEQEYELPAPTSAENPQITE